MNVLISKVIRWKYILSGLILCWLLVGLPYVTTLSTWGFVILITLGSYKVVKIKFQSSYIALPATLIMTLLVAVNTRGVAIYQDLSFKPDIWISQQHRPVNGEHLNVVTNDSDFLFLKQPYDFPVFQPTANYILTGHYRREVRLNTPIIKEYPPANKLFLHLRSDYKNTATLKIDDTQKYGVHYLTYSLYDKSNKQISKATFQYRTGFIFEKKWDPRFGLNDKKISSLSYLLHKNPLSIYIASFVPEQNETPLEKFLSIALTKPKPYWEVRAEKVANDKSQQMIKLTKKDILSDELLKEPVPINSATQEEVKNKLSSLFNIQYLELISCRKLLNEKPSMFSSPDLVNVKRRLLAPISQINLSVGRSFFCTDDAYISTTLRQENRFPKEVFVRKGQKLLTYYIAIDGDDFYLEHNATPLYNTLVINEESITLTWAIIEPSPQIKLVPRPAGGDFEGGFREVKYSYNLPFLPLDVPIMKSLKITRLVKVKYSKPNISLGNTSEGK